MGPSWPLGVVECPLGPMNPSTGQQVVYTPPCTRTVEDSIYRTFDGRGVLIYSDTP